MKSLVLEVIYLSILRDCKTGNLWLGAFDVKLVLDSMGLIYKYIPYRVEN